KGRLITSRSGGYQVTVDDVVSALLSACPSIGPAWQEHLAFWGEVSDRGVYNDASVIAHHVVDSFERGDLSELPAVFAVLERCLIEGNDNVQNLVTVGVLEDIQNIASHRPMGPLVFYKWLGPKSQAEWIRLCEFWKQVADAKAAGLLEPRSGESSAPTVAPNDIDDPA